MSDEKKPSNEIEVVRKYLLRMKDDLVKRDPLKSNDFKVIDALLNEYDAVTCATELQRKLEIAVRAMKDARCAWCITPHCGCYLCNALKEIGE
jgi:hypothetical protein